ncbi:MAG: UMP kinase [Candidatus Methanoperedens sp.]|nr:UMP kinase [Candidatus Methanoperedens sp.]
MKIVVSIGGSVLAKELKPDKFRNYASAFREIAKDHTLFIVTGGGKAAREYIGVARELGASEAVSDDIGIQVTRLNARLMISAIGDDAFHEPPETYRDALKAAITGKIVVMGGVVPGQTTDAVSAILAEYTGADLLINATATDGVYTSDPKKDLDAKKFDSMTAKQLIEIVTKTDMAAGANSPVDILASKIIERSSIRTIVLNGEKPGNIVDAVKGKHNGTVIEG